ncbi:MAG: CdaR family protein [bacterium JZ-2024 1]
MTPSILKKLNLKEFPLQVLSFLIAFGIWSNVRHTVVTAERQLLLIPAVSGLPGEFTIPDIHEYKIPVLLRGRREIIQTIASRSISARLDFSELDIKKSGQFRVPVLLGDLPEGVTVVSAPPFLNVRLEHVHHIRRRVEITYVKRIPASVRVLSAGTEPSEVDLSGPSSEVSRVHTVRIEIDPTTLQAGAPRDFPVNVLDAQGRTIGNLTVEPPVVRLVARIERLLTSRVVPVEPNVQGAPAPGYAISAVRVEPATVLLSGDDAQLAPIHAVSTKPLAITNLSRSIKFKDVGLLIPESLTADITKVLVSIEIRPARVQQAFRVPVILKLPEGWRGEVSPGQVQVTLEGLTTDLARVNPNALSAVIVISTPSPGKLGRRVEVEAPPATRVVHIEPEYVEITVSRYESRP